jgi:hypothetical protein
MRPTAETSAAGDTQNGQLTPRATEASSGYGEGAGRIKRAGVGRAVGVSPR